MNFNDVELPVMDAENEILRMLPVDTAALMRRLTPRFRRRDLNQALQNLLETRQVQRTDDRLELQQGAADRAAFRSAALEALAPVLDWWTVLTPAEQRRELLYAVEGRFRVSRKRCPGCQQLLLRTAFGIHRQRPDGLQSRCRACRRQRA